MRIAKKSAHSDFKDSGKQGSSMKLNPVFARLMSKFYAVSKWAAE